jgi:hypothetical protein
VTILSAQTYCDVCLMASGMAYMHVVGSGKSGLPSDKSLANAYKIGWKIADGKAYCPGCQIKAESKHDQNVDRTIQRADHPGDHVS